MKLALIGNWGHHVHVLLETDEMADVTMAALAPGFTGEDLSSLQEKYSDAVTYDDHRGMLEAVQPDVVIISTQLDLIPYLAIDAANAGCHSICEKPLATEHDALQKLWKAVVANRTQCIAMLSNRNQPVLAYAGNQIKAGRIGEVKLLNARKSYKFSNERAAWLRKRSTYGGTIPWIGIHALDFIDAVTDTSFCSVSAMHANAAHPQHPEIEDSCIMNIRCKNGALATASVDYLRPQSANCHGDDWLRIVGTEGILEVCMDRGQCTIIDSDGHSEIINFDEKQAYYAPLIRIFPKAGTAMPTEETRRSFNLTHVGLCARDAADTGTIVNDLSGPWIKNQGENDILVTDILGTTY